MPQEEVLKAGAFVTQSANAHKTVRSFTGLRSVTHHPAVLAVAEHPRMKWFLENLFHPPGYGTTVSSSTTPGTCMTELDKTKALVTTLPTKWIRVQKPGDATAPHADCFFFHMRVRWTSASPPPHPLHMGLLSHPFMLTLCLCLPVSIILCRPDVMLCCALIVRRA